MVKQINLNNVEILIMWATDCIFQGGALSIFVLKTYFSSECHFFKKDLSFNNFIINVCTIMLGEGLIFPFVKYFLENKLEFPDNFSRSTLISLGIPLIDANLS